MKNLFEINKLWMTNILIRYTDEELKAFYEIIQGMYNVLDSFDDALLYEFLDELEKIVIEEILYRFFHSGQDDKRNNLDIQFI